MKIKNKIPKILALTAAMYITVCLVLFPERCINASVSALSLCASAVVPTLFPFFVCSSLFVSLGLAGLAARRLGGIMQPMFKVSGAGAVAVLLGIISGYPVGAKCAADLYSQHKISKTETERLLAFCNNSGPMFVIGTVGVVMYHSVKIGIMLYIIHVLSSLIAGMVYARIHSGSGTKDAIVCCDKSDGPSVFSVFGDAISGASLTILKVCGFVVFFAVVGATLPQFKGQAYLMAFLEITNGIKVLTAENQNIAVTLPIVSFFLAFSGVSVLLQVGAVISDTNINIKSYAIGKCIQAAAAFSLAVCVCAFTPVQKLGAVAMAPAAAFTADTGLWYASSAVEVCGWCAAIIVMLCIVCPGVTRIKCKRFVKKPFQER